MELRYFGVIGLILFLVGCISQPAQPEVVEVVHYQCANGEFADAPSKCAQLSCPEAEVCPTVDCGQCTLKADPVVLTKYQCYDGAVVDDIINCLTFVAASENIENCLIITDHQKNFNDYGMLVITGEVKNSCDHPINQQIYFTLYDTKGKILKQDFTYPEPSNVPANSTAGFEEFWTDDYINNQFGSYKVYLGQN